MDITSGPLARNPYGIHKLIVIISQLDGVVASYT